MKGFISLILGGLVLAMLLFQCNRHNIDRAAKDFQAYQQKDLLEDLR